MSLRTKIFRVRKKMIHSKSKKFNQNSVILHLNWFTPIRMTTIKTKGSASRFGSEVRALALRWKGPGFDSRQGHVRWLQA